MDTPVKQSYPDENVPPIFLNSSGPPKKRIRRVAQPLTEQVRQQATEIWHRKQKADEENVLALKEAKRKEADVTQQEEATSRVHHVLQDIVAAGYPSFYSFLHEFISTKDRAQSSQFSRILFMHGSELLDSIWKRQPSMTDAWVMKTTGEILAEEGQRLAELLRPPQGQPITHTLETFSLDHVVATAAEIALTLCNALRCVSSTETQHEKERKNKDLVHFYSIAVLNVVQTDRHV
jgi:hypothetical protein